MSGPKATNAIIPSPLSKKYYIEADANGFPLQRQVPVTHQYFTGNGNALVTLDGSDVFVVQSDIAGGPLVISSGGQSGNYNLENRKVQIILEQACLNDVTIRYTPGDIHVAGVNGVSNDYTFVTPSPMTIVLHFYTDNDLFLYTVNSAESNPVNTDCISCADAPASLIGSEQNKIVSIGSLNTDIQTTIAGDSAGSVIADATTISGNVERSGAIFSQTSVINAGLDSSNNCAVVGSSTASILNLCSSDVISGTLNSTIDGCDRSGIYASQSGLLTTGCVNCSLNGTTKCTLDSSKKCSISSSKDCIVTGTGQSSIIGSRNITMDTSTRAIVLASDNLNISGAVEGVFGGMNAVLWSLNSTNGDITSTGAITGSTLSGSLTQSDITPGVNGQILTTVAGVSTWANPAVLFTSVLARSAIALVSYPINGIISFPISVSNTSGIVYNVDDSLTIPAGIYKFTINLIAQRTAAPDDNVELIVQDFPGPGGLYLDQKMQILNGQILSIHATGFVTGPKTIAFSFVPGASNVDLLAQHRSLVFEKIN